MLSYNDEDEYEDIEGTEEYYESLDTDSWSTSTVGEWRDLD